MGINTLVESSSAPPEKFTGVLAVVGADGFVGGNLASALQAKKIVYGPCRIGDIHITQAEELLKQADVVINAAGFRVRPGCTYADYQQSHEGATARLVPQIREGALLLHISSASVLGKSKHQKLGLQTQANPTAFPCPAYALAKLETDQFLEKASAEHGFKVIFLRPAVIYSPNGASMIETLMRLAKRGITLRLHPREARHHLCHTSLLAEVTRRVIEKRDHLPHLSRFIVADPFTVTNRQLENMIRRCVAAKTLTVPIPSGLVTALLSHTFHSKNPKLDFKTRGEIFGVLNMDSEYDPSETFTTLGIDASQYAIEKT